MDCDAAALPTAGERDTLAAGCTVATGRVSWVCGCTLPETVAGAANGDMTAPVARCTVPLAGTSGTTAAVAFLVTGVDDLLALGLCRREAWAEDAADCDDTGLAGGGGEICTTPPSGKVGSFCCRSAAGDTA